MSDDIEARIRRLYTAIGETVEDDLSKFRPVVSAGAGGTSFRMDFRGGLTDEQLMNMAQSAIGHVASLRDHLIRWARRAGYDESRVDAAVQASPALQILMDLWNADKHGGAARKPLSGKNPKLINVDRALAISTRRPGEAVELMPTPDGLDTHGSPNLRVTIVGTVVDENGTRIGILPQLLEDGLRAWERVLQDGGLL